MTRVLLIEDNKADSTLVKQLLPADRYQITWANSLRKAEEYFVPKPDIVLLDLSLPDSAGLESFSRVNRRAQELPVIILTGNADEELALSAIKLGAQDFIPKQELTAGLLIRRIRYAIERKRNQEASMALLEQRDDSIATLTHDLKAPLMGANLILEALAGQRLGKLSGEQAQLLLKLRDANRSVLSMIHKLNNLYKPDNEADTLSLQDIDPIEVLSASIGELSMLADSRRVKLQTYYPARRERLRADAGALHRLFQNLLHNAVKFSPEDQVVSVRVENGDSFTVHFQDHGPGIPRDEQDQLFLRFVQGEAGRRLKLGAGLGLYICRQIVEAHHGKISCFSAGEGATFTVQLPWQQ